MRLIDADALQRRICGAKCGCEYEDCGNEGDCSVDHFIFHAPTIDAVPVDTVAKMFCDFTGDSCACDFNDNDEWLSEVCELQDECPYPKDHFGCWKQYIKYYGERKG